MYISYLTFFIFLFYFFLIANAALLEAELASKRDGAPGEATALEALLRGDSLLEKKNSLCKEEETLLEIQVIAPTPHTVLLHFKRNVCAISLLCALQRVLEAEENGDGFHDDDDFEIDTPKRKNRNRSKVRARGHNEGLRLKVQRYSAANIANVH